MNTCEALYPTAIPATYYPQAAPNTILISQKFAVLLSAPDLSRAARLFAKPSMTPTVMSKMSRRVGQAYQFYNTTTAVSQRAKLSASIW